MMLIVLQGSEFSYNKPDVPVNHLLLKFHPVKILKSQKL